MDASLSSRIKALCVDQCLLIGAMYAVTEILESFDEVPNEVRILAFIILFVLYEPFFVSFYGGTIGHSFAKITVRKKKDTDEKISFLSAMIRFLIKMGLGVFSFLILSKKNPQAIHDKIVESLVVYED
ncbi:Uncharacterized membrane protein YckC, RDD family [Pustulibacterium marinum]|uniref:Uncharacterized membrane protein YckC, RDD family n=1 Tax=Pustulibacterium marinum TaxID=1224947 RepID=A0A1I7F939_9FLAO|nr:RDD family protein [Pustulibacterium marinum]SFU32684.1 Uncharacterized membrane protein YckC, RDD family [Pustulibacterium marinum]